MNKLLMEENDRLQKQVSHLVYENGYMKQQIHTVSVRYYSFLFFLIILVAFIVSMFIECIKNICC